MENLLLHNENVQYKILEILCLAATVLFHYESNLRNIMYYNIGYTLLVYGLLLWIYIFAGWIVGRIIGKVFKLKSCKFKYKDYICKTLKCVLGISLLLNFSIFIGELINRFRYYFLNSTELMNPILNSAWEIDEIWSRVW